MLDAIVYCSKSGHTKEYATRLAEQLGLPIFTIRQAKKKLKKSSRIFFLGWVRENIIQGYNKLFAYHIDALAAVGIRPYSEAMMQQLKEENQLYSGLFYLRGGILKRKQSIRNRLLLRTIERNLQFKKLDHGLTLEEQEIEEALCNQKNYLDWNALKPILNHYSFERSNYIS